MSKFAILSGKSVVNIIVADSLEEASVLGTAVEYSDENPAGIGYIYDEETNTFIPPVIESETDA